MVKNVADIYKLTEENLLEARTHGQEVGRQHPREIENSKKLPLERVIYGLGIRFVGERTAQFLAEAFRLDGCADERQRRGAARGERDRAARVGGDRENSSTSRRMSRWWSGWKQQG
jgi:hypothetical protein